MLLAEIFSVDNIPTEKKMLQYVYKNFIRIITLLHNPSVLMKNIY